MTSCHGCKMPSWFHWLNLLTLSAFSMLEVTGKMQTIVEEPHDTRAVLGSRAVLRCRVQNQHGPVTWMKDRFMLGPERSLPAHPRYSMIGSSAHGEYHLEIRDVQLSDDAEYQCQISATVNQTRRRSAPVRLTVLVMPGHPRLSPSTEPISAREGHTVSVTCRTEGSKPPAFISWALVRHANGSGLVRKLYTQNESIIQKRGEGHDVQSVLEYTPQRNDDGSYVACRVEHETLISPLAATLQLRLQYSPKVNVSLNSSDPLLEGRRAVLSCNVDAYPSDNVRYIWYQNNSILHGQNKSQLIIPQLNVHRHQNSVFRCHADNNVDEGGFGDYTLKMKYKPRIISSENSPAEIFVNENQSVTLSCEADSNPPAQIKWYKDTHPQELSSDKNLTLPRFQYVNQGTYTCTAYAEGFEPSSRQFKVYIKGPPRVEIRSLVYARKGAENFQLHCHVRSPPNSDTKVQWKRGDDDYVIGDDGHYSLSPYSDAATTHRSVLTIRKLEPSDFGIYNCSAQNRLGGDFGLTDLVQAEEFPTYAILGVAGGCLAILALALALIIVNRKYLCRSKASTSGDECSDVTLKMQEFYIAQPQPLDYPDMYNSTTADERQHYKGYVQVSQDYPDYDCLPPPCYTTTQAVTHTTFVNGIGPLTGGIDHYGHSLTNGHMTCMTYLDDSLSPATTTTTAMGSIQSDHGLMMNGHSRPLSPLSPVGRELPIAVGVPGPAPSMGSQPCQTHILNDAGHYRPYGMQQQQQPHGMSRNGGVPVDLLNGHLPVRSADLGAMPNGNCSVPASHYGFNSVDAQSTAVYLPPTGYVDQSAYYPTGMLETVQEVPTPDAIDDQPPPSPPNSHELHNHQRQLRSSMSSDDVARLLVRNCFNKLSTHV